MSMTAIRILPVKENDVTVSAGCLPNQPSLTVDGLVFLSEFAEVIFISWLEKNLNTIKSTVGERS